MQLGTSATTNITSTPVSTFQAPSPPPTTFSKGIADPSELKFVHVIYKALQAEYNSFHQFPADGDNTGNFVRSFPQDLLSPEEREYQTFIQTHYDNSLLVGSMPYPHIDRFCAEFNLIPKEILVSWNESKDYISGRYYNDKMVSDIQALQDNNLKNGLMALDGVNEVIQRVQATCSIQTNNAIVLTDIQPSSLADTNQYIKTGIPAIDQTFGGIGRDENVMFFGAPGQGKTLSLRILAMIMAMRGNVAIMPSGEATPTKTAQVMMSMFGGYNWNEWRKAATIEDESTKEHRLQSLVNKSAEGQDKLRSTGGNIIIPDIIQGLEDLDPYMYSTSMKPDAIFLDGYNLLSQDWQQGIDNAAKLARYAVTHETPIFWNTQGNRDAMKGHIPKKWEIAGSKGYYDSASIVFACFGLKIEDEEGRMFPAIGWHCLKMRDMGEVVAQVTVALTVDPIANSINSYDISDAIDIDSTISDIMVENDLGWTVGLTEGEKGHGYFSDNRARRISDEMAIAKKVSSNFEKLTNPTLNLQ